MKKWLVFLFPLTLAGCATAPLQTPQNATILAGIMTPSANSALTTPTTKAPSNQTYYFAKQSITPSPTDNASITAQGNYLATHPHAKIIIVGHTDTTGSPGYNMALGFRRAQSVANLLEQTGVAPQQITRLSYGQTAPQSLAQTQQALAANRRVQLLYLKTPLAIATKKPPSTTAAHLKYAKNTQPSLSTPQITPGFTHQHPA